MTSAITQQSCRL